MIAKTIFDVIEEFDDRARKEAIRTIGNSSLARAIYTCFGLFELEGRNADEHIVDKLRKNADNWAVAYHWAAYHQLAGETWYKVMGFDEMFDFLREKQQNNEELITALSDVLKVSKDDVRRLDQIAAQQRKEIFSSYKSSIECCIKQARPDDEELEYHQPELSIRQQVQLAEKVMKNLEKAKERTILNILRSRSTFLLGDIPLLDHAIKELESWLNSVRLEEEEDTPF